MKAHYHPNVMCPGCRTVMRYENEALYCAHPTCEFFERKYQAPAIELLPYAPADVPTTGGTRLTLSAAQLTLLQHLAAGARTYELLAVKLGKSYGATVVLLNDIKRKCGFGYKQQDALLKLALAQGWVSEIKPAQAVTKTGLPPGYKQTFTQKRPAELAVKPTEEETGQWYFQRYMKQLPNKGEIVFFDRSWYNRAVVEPVNGFCTKEQYERFMRQVPEFEHMLYEDGITLIKFWFSISKQEQLKRFRSRGKNPLKQWKLSPIDAKAQELWDNYTKYKELMFSRTHTTFSPWIIVRANNKMKARLESIRYVLSNIDYEGKTEAALSLHPDPNIVTRFHRSVIELD